MGRYLDTPRSLDPAVGGKGTSGSAFGRELRGVHWNWHSDCSRTAPWERAGGDTDTKLKANTKCSTKVSTGTLYWY
jgi:hypothetical protein